MTRDDGSGTATPRSGIPGSPTVVINGWRGLAHYRTWSRRRVFLQKPQDRTSSELYLLEETIHDVMPIAHLPLAKRMEICKNLGFLQLDSDTTVYNQGDTGNIFYIVFTGSVRSITVVEGVQDDVISHCHPGQSFGVTGIELDDCIRESTYVTAERTELLMLSKQDYDNILMIQKTPELKERVQFLK